ncbi:uncharacterized protein Z520_05791 [Fonsecaea multimorphosa CBS 102226]|uniref:Transcription factor domain-containing protein n=1 Tax=Fonsecaea multimorphosa CBS 102226 TaxID=1442371 RepID=A0A0D2H9G3_9EURO|nr:uncharacterized protein Z520_05791 [Fonsecaea multimorphosa CBS 102226]KIX98490.1 hypothetical protein Z520_05791 [Fonsecaea multimorphosa CBS 102226]
MTDIKKFMVQYKALQYSLLACSASHLHFVDAAPWMQELALVYYSNSVKGLSEALREGAQLKNDDAFLTSVILLYIHGCMGRGTYTDIPLHVNAATRILKLRLLSSSGNISRPFDRLAIESVFYQIFLVTTGSWSDPLELDYHFDAGFWLQAERLLAQSNLYLGCSIGFNSPVIGVPIALVRIVLSLKQFYQSPSQPDQGTLDQIRAELDEWESLVYSGQDLDHLSEHERPILNLQMYRDAGYLYILTSSLLLYQLSGKTRTPGPPQAVPRTCWQMKTILHILRGYRDNDDWARLLLGNWPVYSVGFFMSHSEDIWLIRNDLQRRWDLVKFSQVSRFRTDLESTWNLRGYDIDTSCWLGP